MILTTTTTVSVVTIRKIPVQLYVQHRGVWYLSFEWLNSCHLIFIRIPYPSYNGGIFFCSHFLARGKAMVTRKSKTSGAHSCNVFPSELLKLLLEIKILDKDIPPFTPRPTGTLKSFFRGEKYLNAKMKNMKVYTEQELKSPQSELKRKRRRFWNDKAEQLAKSPKTSQ